MHACFALWARAAAGRAGGHTVAYALDSRDLAIATLSLTHGAVRLYIKYCTLCLHV